MIKYFIKSLLPFRKLSATSEEIHAGCAPAGRYLTIFASFDHFSRLPDYVVCYLSELKRQGCDIVFVTTSPSLPPPALEALRPLCIRIIRRQNVGLDFASWRAGFDQVGKPRHYEGLLLANDSVLGPFKPLDKIFSQIEQTKYEVIGLNDSREFGYHLQSFFVYYPMAVFLSQPVQRYWSSIRVLKDKQDIINRYEIGFSKYLAEQGILQKALFPIEALKSEALRLGTSFEFCARLQQDLPINPTLHYWQVLFDLFDYPFVKRELLTLNPIGSKYVDDFKKTMRNSSDNMAKIVTTYLANGPVLRLPQQSEPV